MGCVSPRRVGGIFARHAGLADSMIDLSRAIVVAPNNAVVPESKAVDDLLQLFQHSRPHRDASAPARVPLADYRAWFDKLGPTLPRPLELQRQLLLERVKTARKVS
jgi:hypothetical protein